MISRKIRCYIEATWQKTRKIIGNPIRTLIIEACFLAHGLGSMMPFYEQCSKMAGESGSHDVCLDGNILDNITGWNKKREFGRDS